MISYDEAYQLTLAAWCVQYGYAVETFVVRDDADLIREKLLTCLRGYDAVVTSGGAWRKHPIFLCSIR